jgi:hypothetical protein
MWVGGGVTSWRNAFGGRSTREDIGCTTYFRADLGIILVLLIFKFVLDMGVAMRRDTNWR